MPGLATITLIGLVVLAVLVVMFMKARQSDLIGAQMEKRRASSKLVSRADYIEGAEKLPVALSLTNDTLYYENADLEASFELTRLDEIEYDDDISTGRNVGADSRVLRLRSHGATFEFILPKLECDKWRVELPPRSYGQSTTAQAV